MSLFRDPRRAHPYLMYDMIRGQPGFVAETISRTKDADGKRFLGSRRRFFVTACGTSFHAAIYGARVLRLALGNRASVEAVHAFDLRRSGLLSPRCTVLGVSHSGATRTTNEALVHARRRGAPTIGLCGVKDSPMGDLVDRILVTGSTHDRSWANTMSYTTQLTALARLAISLEADGWTSVSESWFRLPATLAGVLRSEPACRRIAHRVAQRSRVTFLGTSLDEITALEAALKIRETCSLSASAYHTEQFLHGPFLSLDAAEAVVALRSRDDGAQADRSLRAFARTGALVARIGDGTGVAVRLPKVPPVLRPIVSVVPMQFLAYYAALARKVNPDVMRTDRACYRPGVEILLT